MHAAAERSSGRGSKREILRRDSRASADVSSSASDGQEGGRGAPITHLSVKFVARDLRTLAPRHVTEQCRGRGASLRKGSSMANCSDLATHTNRIERIAIVLCCTTCRRAHCDKAVKKASTVVLHVVPVVSKSLVPSEDAEEQRHPPGQNGKSIGEFLVDFGVKVRGPSTREVLPRNFTSDSTWLASHCVPSARSQKADRREPGYHTADPIHEAVDSGRPSRDFL